MNTPVILIVEDDDYQYEIYEDALAEYQRIRAVTGRGALAAVKKQRPDLIILDHILAQGQLGLDYLPELKELLPHVPIIIVSGALEVNQKMSALQGPRRAHYCIAKPVDVNDLQRTVKTALIECGETEVVRQFEALERSKRIDAEALFSRSTDRLKRQNEILAHVKHATDRPNVSALARQYHVARRTIIRDLEELIRRGQLPPESFPKWSSEDPEADSD
jgi:DNA-binding NtrC family response regulator